MDQNSQYQLELVFEINDCTLYDISQGKAKVLNMGVLAIYELRSQNLIVLKMGQWQYSLSKQIPIMAQQQVKQKIYALPKQGGNFGLLLGPRTTTEQESILESIFSKYGDFVEAQEDHEQVSDSHKLSSSPLQNSNEIPTSKKIQGFLQKGGDFIRSGLITGAGYLAKGIQSGGQYIKSKITKPTQKEIKPETLAKVKMAKATSSAILTFTSAQVTALISGAKVIGSEISDQISKSETGQKMQSHKNYGDVKNVAKGTVHAFAAIYDGMFEGLCAIGRGFQGATTEVVAAKYGDSAGQLTHESFETAANVGNLTQVYKTEAIKAFHQGTQSKIYDH